MVQEDLLERGLTAAHVVTGCSASAAISGPTLPETSNRNAFGPALCTWTPGSGRSSGAWPRERDLDRLHGEMAQLF